MRRGVGLAGEMVLMMVGVLVKRWEEGGDKVIGFRGKRWGRRS